MEASSDGDGEELGWWRLMETSGDVDMMKVVLTPTFVDIAH